MKKSAIKKNCLICDKEFMVIPSRLKVGRGKYCSRRCSDIIILRKGRPSPNKGKILSLAWRKKLSEAHKGIVTWMKGKRHSKNSLLKMSESHKKNPSRYWLGKKRIEMEGKNNWKWKENDYGYRTIHLWIQGRLGKASKCSNNVFHKSTRYHWANISGEYKRDINDWIELCPFCNFNDGIKISKRFYEGRANL